MGAIDNDLAEFFVVNELTINRWKEKHSDFCKSLKTGKGVADAKVVRALFITIDGKNTPGNRQGTYTRERMKCLTTDLTNLTDKK